MKQVLWMVLMLALSGSVFAADTAEEEPAPKEGCEKAEAPEPKKKKRLLSGDMKRRVDFSRKLSALLEKDEAVDPDILVEQLQERTRCEVSGLRPAGDTVKSASEIYRDCRDSVVVIGHLGLCDKCDELHFGAASGFVVSSNGVVATNYHVMFGEKRKAAGVMLADGTVYGIKEVLAASKLDDVALVRIDAEGLTPVALRADEPVGSDVVAIGHPASRFYTMTRGIISRYSHWYSDGQPTKRMEITADFARGSSGGPILNDRGDAVGMVKATTGIYYTRENGEKKNLQTVIKSCVPAESILALIKTDDGE